MPQPDYYLGLMSGTSMDGIDAALLELEEDSFRLIDAIEHPWPKPLQQALSTFSGDSQPIRLEQFGAIDHQCGQTFAQAAMKLLEQTHIPPGRISAIGTHGQTLYHHPQGSHPFTLQIGDPNLIAEKTGITTVADFRRRDMAAGGQGAPLVPAFHQAAFQHPRFDRVILNIGGIANITLLSAKKGLLGGFDTGPGNCLMDYWSRKHLNRPHDTNGNWATTGQTNEQLLELLLNDPFFPAQPPKSTGTEYFSPHWLNRRLVDFTSLPAVDVQATLLSLTAASITLAIDTWAKSSVQVLVCGGGVHNTALMKELSSRLPGKQVCSTAEITPGMDPDWIEAMAFAWLASRTLARLPGNAPAVTGARHPVILGAIYPGQREQCTATE